MKINNIKVYQIDIPLIEKAYKWANENIVYNFDCTIVVIETDNNIQGVGEVCNLGSSYLPAYSKGVRSGILEIGKNLIGKDPTNIKFDLLKEVLNFAILESERFFPVLQLVLWGGKKAEEAILFFDFKTEGKA